MEIVEIVNNNQEKGIIQKLIFKDNSSFFIEKDSKFEALGKEFVYIEAESIMNGKVKKSIKNIREIRSIDIIDNGEIV